MMASGIVTGPDLMGSVGDEVTATRRWFHPQIDMASAASPATYKPTTEGLVSPSRSVPSSVVSPKTSHGKDHKSHVNFDTENPELSDRKKKYLTAKYGQHQMNLIKKRLRVEMWMYDQLQALYGTEDSSDLEIDLDELLDMEDEKSRERWLRGQLTDVKSDQDQVDRFVQDLLERAKTL